jgi:putative hydrolases of HD superfamily
MVKKDTANKLAFIRAAGKLKDTLRSAHTEEGRQESTAEHTWRLCLWVMVFREEFPEVDFEKVLSICIVHDLGEAISGDIPAIYQDPTVSKSADERRDFETLLMPLSLELKTQFLTLWDEYEAAETLEAKLVKGLDKLETIMQHNQGANSADFDYEFNLTYGLKHTSAHSVLNEIREILDKETNAKANGRK